MCHSEHLLQKLYFKESTLYNVYADIICCLIQ